MKITHIDFGEFIFVLRQYIFIILNLSFDNLCIGITTPLANWSAEEPWPTTNRENNWTHPVESVDTAPPSGTINN